MRPKPSNSHGSDDPAGEGVRLQVLGMVAVTKDGEPAEELLRRRKPLALFAYLALARSDRFIQRDHLCDVFWPDSVQLRARASLRQALATINRALPDTLEALGTEAVRVVPGAVHSDLDDFLRAVERADWSTAAALGGEELFQGFHVPRADRFEHWVDGLKARVREERRKFPSDALAADARKPEIAVPEDRSAQPRAPMTSPPRRRQVARSVLLAATTAAILVLVASTNPFARGTSESPLEPLIVLAPFETESDADSVAALAAFARDAIALGLRRRLAGVTVVAADNAAAVRRPDAVYVSGNLWSTGGSARLEVQISDVDGELIRILEPVTLERLAPNAAIDPIGDGISVVASDRFRHVRLRSRATLLEDAEVPSLDAYLSLARAKQHSARNRWSLALIDARRAVTLAPAWTEARLELATHLSNNGRPELADSILTEIVRGDTPLGPFQRLRVDRLVAVLNNDRRGRLRTERATLRMEGRAASIQLAYELLGVGRPSEALEVLALLDRDEMIRREVFRYWGFAAQAHHQLGEYATELSVARDGLQLFPEHPPLVWSEVAALAAMGRDGEVLARVERAASTFSECCPLSVALAAGDELAYHGSTDAAAEVYRRGHELSAEPDYWEERYTEVLLLMRLERWEDARRRLEPLLDASTDPARDFGSMGVIAASLGRTEEARDWIDRLDPAGFRGIQRPGALLSRARVAAALGMDEDAMGFLNEAATRGLASGLGVHDPVFERLRNLEAFKVWATPRELLASR